ncbi:MAG: hypothetical protein KKB51_23465 [Candidatus Riflebacteria bacterium]|nr:hypothetical protein [Candidatus Riflebacteria bacterium]
MESKKTKKTFDEIINHANNKIERLKGKNDSAQNPHIFEGEIFLEKLVVLHQKKPSAPILELADELHTLDKESLKKHFAKLIEQARAFAIASKMSEEEQNDHLDGVRQKNKKELQIFDAQVRFNLDLLKYEASEDDETLVSILAAKGYKAYPIAELKVLFSGGGLGAKQKLAPPLPKQKIGSGGYDVVTNGTFFGYTDKCYPLGTVIRNGILDYECKHPKTQNRGGIAVLNSGKIVIKGAQGGTPEDIKREFGQPCDPVKDYIGGGVLLRANKETFPGEQIFYEQQFNDMQSGYDNSDNGLKAKQMYRTWHVVFGLHQQNPYLIIPAKKKDAQAFQKELEKAGFSDVIEFNGGNEFCLSDSDNPEHKKGKNSPTGFGIKISRDDGS